MNKLLFATHNRHKADEVKLLLPTWEVFTLTDIGFDKEIAETGTNFRENAQIKVEALLTIWDGLIISDDSGLIVDSLNGAPGVHSKRYSASGLAEDNNAKLLKELAGKQNRKAAFVAVFCCKMANDFHFFEGRVEGQIAQTLSGMQGFGYDPIFIPDGYDKSFADLGAQIKNSISHRAKAVQKLNTFLDNR